MECLAAPTVIRIRHLEPSSTKPANNKLYMDHLDGNTSCNGLIESK
jgi:hypothetical protein